MPQHTRKKNDNFQRLRINECLAAPRFLKELCRLFIKILLAAFALFGNFTFRTGRFISFKNRLLSNYMIISIIRIF